MIQKVAVIRCKGRITLGAEASALEAEVDRLTKVHGTDTYLVKRVVLNLGETEFIDSFGLGTLVRLFGVLRAVGGALKLCRMSPRVSSVIETTHLQGVFPAYTSELQAIEAFSAPVNHPGDGFDGSRIRIVCVDTSKDLLAGLSGLLNGSGYQVFTTRYIGEAGTLVRSTKPKLVICGPGVASMPTAPGIIEAFRKDDPKLKLLTLTADFHTTEAGQAAQELLLHINSLVTG